MERKSLESAAVIYSYMRGLLSIPAGILLVLAGLSNLQWGPLRHVWVFVGAMVLAGAAYLLITRYYSANYGRVTPSTTAQVRAVVVTLVDAAVVVGGVRLDWTSDLPVSGTATAFALIMLFAYAVKVRLRAHHVIICGSLLVAGLVPIWGRVGADAKINVGLILAGIATIATGIFDHGALRRTFGPAGDLDHGNSDAGE
ncbi:hypothetical protein N5079_09390 [Planotetraspora sp. A-T 1434]|uniref:hypothetical protein n=1 Tax=Planotetraspora sp. A-T 1434 TaxID=2979219 RepID=UPI0021C08E34|nr:hypothetical protein [Planotetraspora sp. A-T 1434]MCT9930431.1 hypothetical protein [Planotetraspora sp. A-T 1434]